MSEATQQWDFFEDLYRFATVLTTDTDAALRSVTDALDFALKRPRSQGDLDRLMVLLFQDVRARVLKHSPGRKMRKSTPGELPTGAGTEVASMDATTVRSAIHGLAEPGRSALALLYLDILESEEIQKVLGMTQAELGEWLRGARVELHAALVSGEVRA